MTEDEKLNKLMTSLKHTLIKKYLEKDIFISDLTFDIRNRHDRDFRLGGQVQFYKTNKEGVKAFVSQSFDFDLISFVLDKISEKIDDHKFIVWDYVAKEE